jgi:hypothetical protein
MDFIINAILWGLSKWWCWLSLVWIGIVFILLVLMAVNKREDERFEQLFMESAEKKGVKIR